MILDGRIDSANAEDWEKKIMAGLPEEGDYELDCAALNYISSAGIRIIISLYKTLRARENKLVLKDVSDSVMQVLELTGVSEFLTFI
ncbi:MAG: STAS domain-containing protein [Ruminobacter sp.]|uniref:STAS domain-containing protein n=1 Tax=Ruminobacter sp. TaxID=2774296 RepID=UPI001B414B00|nr:STAS domain-containing protein [Ruminobacter sp.]MBP3748000.1 STAS domain-containing protein [Ruminobacter sp.]